MPTYEFRCPQGHEFEKFYRTISGAEAQAACPVCGQVAERFMSPTGFAFKGSGFYLTDYGKNAHREKPPEAKSESSASGSAGEGEAKPAAKADAPAPSESKKTESTKPAETKPAAAPAKKKSSDE